MVYRDLMRLNWDFPWVLVDYNPLNGIYPLVMINIAMVSMALIEIDGLPCYKNGWIFPWQTGNVITRGYVAMEFTVRWGLRPKSSKYGGKIIPSPKEFIHITGIHWVNGELPMGIIHGNYSYLGYSLSILIC
jgi:hypothetical protein